MNRTAWPSSRPDRIRRYHRRHYRKLKAGAFAAYGRSCQCCGEDEARFLTIDHIRQDGAKHRRETGVRTSGMNMYRWLKVNRYPPGFQVLCYNCNCGRYRNGGVCPHRDDEHRED